MLMEMNKQNIDNILNQDSKVQWQFRTLVHEFRQGEKTDLADQDLTSYGHFIHHLSFVWK